MLKWTAGEQVMITINHSLVIGAVSPNRLTYSAIVILQPQSILFHKYYAVDFFSTFCWSWNEFLIQHSSKGQFWFLVPGETDQLHFKI